MFKKTYLICAMLAALCILLSTSCAPKYGCPSNGKNVGAERILQSGKSPKVKKMKV